MKSCLVLGAGRSGTSMVAGTLVASGYFGGRHTWEGQPGNPKGFYEDRQVNSINEQLLAVGLDQGFADRVRARMPARISPWHRWLMPLPEGAKVVSSPRLDRRIERVLRSRPFALKDPRFCFTLPAWRPHLPSDTRFVVVFREPSRTIRSMIKEVGTASYLRRFELTEASAEHLWLRSYEEIVRQATDTENWLFVHYDQVLDGSGLSAISRHLDSAIDESFVDVALRRSKGGIDVGAEASAMYEDLCRRANFTYAQ